MKQSLEAIDVIIEELKKAHVQPYQQEAYEAIEKAVNALEVAKRNLYTLQVIATKIDPEYPNEWKEAECFRTCVSLAQRALSKTEPKTKWVHPLND